jgi:regulator of RNase E activity RraA
MNVPFQLGPRALRPVSADMWCRGRAHPVRHDGSVDVVLAALAVIEPGEILVVDNAGRMDEACLGELIVLEAAAGGVGGLVIWGCHRDTAGLVAIDLPVFSLGAFPLGPHRASAARVDQPQSVAIGSAVVNAGDIVIADGDGLLVLAPEQFAQALPVALELHHTERAQAEAVANGLPLREQLQFAAYLALRGLRPTYSFRDHVREINAAIEA